MKADELMIGDWVQIERPDIFDTIPCEIHSLMYHKEDDGVYFHVFIDSTEHGFHTEEVFNEDLEPIRLTVEILEKNGFVRAEQVSDEYPYYLDEDGNMFYSLKDGDTDQDLFWGWWQPDNKFCMPNNCTPWVYIEYVHQLQHALRFCGIQKEIEL